MPFEHLVSTIDGAVATVMINRPKVLNALDAATLGELDEAMRGLQADASVRVVILTGAGDRAFVAGADITELATLAPDGAKAHAELGQRVFDRVEHLGKPVIAAAYGASDEWHQFFVPGRQSDWHDLAADAAGAAAVAGALWAWGIIARGSE